MKPFDLERALAGDPVVTRGGKKVLELHYFKNIKLNYPLVAVVEEQELLMAYTEKGIYVGYKDNIESENDLFMAPKTKKLWIAVCKTKINSSNEDFYDATCAFECRDKLEKILTKIGDQHKYQIIEIEVEE